MAFTTIPFCVFNSFFHLAGDSSDFVFLSPSIISLAVPPKLPTWLPASQFFIN